MGIKHEQSYVTVGIFGKASAEYWVCESDGEQVVIVHVGEHVSVFMPFAQAVALRADLDAALDKFTAVTDPEPESGAVA
ncbi:hypothetical protein [Nocardia concava]|uniref:hypothetical protein n=1 Tax=Nocardia concava TaxID=257281 RepID=UPI00031DE38D|nr:hypothetical protein [Nocardia concava]